jgi:hypothetical protein
MALRIGPCRGTSLAGRLNVRFYAERNCRDCWLGLDHAEKKGAVEPPFSA